MSADPKKQIKSGFENLSGPTSFKVTSQPTKQYNCIAWAAGDSSNWWWPIEGKYWPAGVERSESIASFEAAFGTVGYVKCASAVPEEGFEKIAIYTKGQRPTHAARQLPNGQWTSKLGESWDISHRLVAGVSGKIYGDVTVYMKRAIT
jgi:hypothetical protein